MIRLAMQRDVPEILRIDGEYDDTFWTTEEFKLLLKQPDIVVLIKEHEGEIVGFIVYELADDNIFYLIKVGVNSEHWRKGFGSKLVTEIKKKTNIRKERTKICTYVSESNLRAQLFFKEIGFIATKVVADYYENGDAAYQMFWEKK